MENAGVEAERNKGLEGKISSARSLKEYARMLHFDPTLLREQNVLNFGSGGSHIGKELQKRKIQSNVVDVDLELVGVGKNSIRLKGIEKLLSTNPNSWGGKILNSLQTKATMKDNRNFVQADGRNLPFKDKAFDTVLALWSTYQILDKDKKRVFRELMRVGNAIYCGPITKTDFEILVNLSQEMGFDIIASRPFSEHGIFTATSLNDYSAYTERYSAAERIKIPQVDSLKTYGLFGRTFAADVLDGNYIVLKRVSQ